MNIGIDVTFLIQDKRGMGRYTASVISMLLSLGHKFYFVSNRNLEEGLRKDFPAGNWEFINYKKAKDIEFIDCLWHPWNRIDLLGAARNIVHIHDTLPYKEFADNIGLKYLKKDRKRLVKAVDLSDLIITISEFSKKEIMNDLNVTSSKIKIIPPGVSDFFENKKFKDDEKKTLLDKYSGGFPYVLYIGFPDKRKNWLNLLTAFRELKDRHKVKHKFVLVGRKPAKPGFFSKDRENAQVIFMIDALIDKGELILREEVTDREIVELYNLADLFVFPSIYEGFGLPVLEAQACGAPIAIAGAASLPEVAGYGAVKFDPYNPRDIAEKMFSILSGNDLRKNIIKAGFENVKRFSYENSAKELMKVFRESAPRMKP